MNRVPSGFRIPLDIEILPKNLRNLLGKILLVHYTDSNTFYPGKVTRYEKKTVIVQYFGDDYENKVEEDVKEGVWLFDGNEEAFFNAFPQYKGQNKTKGAKLTYNEMVIDSLYVMNDKGTFCTL